MRAFNAAIEQKMAMALGRQLAASAVKSAADRLGFVIRRVSPQTSPGARLQAILQHFRVDLVFDVGANTGQFATLLRKFGYSDPIVSFEPLSDAHAELCSRKANDRSWFVHERCALGNATGNATIHVAGNSASSSLLPMMDLHVAAAPNTAYVAQECVKVTTLDAVYPEYRKLGDRPFLKVDTQGFERQVLEGAELLLRDAVGLELELSLAPLYQGQELWDYFLRYLDRRGFRLWAVEPSFVDLRTGQTLQIDATFVRN